MQLSDLGVRLNRQSAGTQVPKDRHWSVGLTLYDEMVMKQTEHVAVTVSSAVTQYLEDCQARHLHRPP
jgi:hypothetical protein